MKKNYSYINIIGSGLAGSEAALYLASKGINIHLYEMKPLIKSPAHKSDNFAEIVCSNSFKSMDETTASGLLKAELKMLNSPLMNIAYKFALPSGSALAVDRDLFSEEVTKLIKQNSLITVKSQLVNDIDPHQLTILATGPLTDESLLLNLKNLIGEDNLYFYDATSPIVRFDSIDMTKSFIANRYNKGEGIGDYINCPLNKEEYEIFYNELINAKTVQLKSFENQEVFKDCIPVEILAKREKNSLRYGPMKPIGLTDPKLNKKCYAVVQLRRDNTEGTLYNIVGFQTNLTFAEQKRVFSLIPALNYAHFIKFGVMHRNSYINAPKILNEFSALKKYPKTFIAGQLSGVEGYVESIASGLYCGINARSLFLNKNLQTLSNYTCLGALIKYITTNESEVFNPMNANYGIIPPLAELIKDKKEKYIKIKERSIIELQKYIRRIN